jgi:hypothetical protein
MRATATRVALVLLASMLVAVAGGCASEAVPGDEAFDPTAPSGPAEAVARTLRLAGFEEVIVDGGSTAVARLKLPSVNSAADVELAWQAAMSALSVAYPTADEYVVQIASDRDLLQVAADGESVREAVGADDASMLREAATFELVHEEASPRGLAVSSYDASSDEVATYLDVKNRVAGLVGMDGIQLEEGDSARRAVQAAREAVPGVAAVEPGEDAGATWVARTVTVLAAADAVGASELAEQLSSQGGMSREDIAQAREWFHVASAVDSAEPYGSVVQESADITSLVLEESGLEGDAAQAVRVALRDADALSSARRVDEFERVESADTSGTGDSDQLPDLVILANGGEAAVIAYLDEGDTSVVNAQSWHAYERGDGARFWLAVEDGDVALTDASIQGWMFATEQAALVDARDVGRRLEVYPTR